MEQTIAITKERYQIGLGCVEAIACPIAIELKMIATNRASHVNWDWFISE